MTLAQIRESQRQLERLARPGVTEYCYSLSELPHGGGHATPRDAFGIRFEVSLATRGMTPLRVSK